MNTLTTRVVVLTFSVASAVMAISFQRAEGKQKYTQGRVVSVDLDAMQLAVRVARRTETIFAVTHETVIYRLDPNTREEELLELEDIEPGNQVRIEFARSGEESTAWIIEVET